MCQIGLKYISSYYFTYSLQVSEADADSNNSAAGIMDLANLGIRKRVVQLNVDDKKVSVGSEATGKKFKLILTTNLKMSLVPN